MEAGAPRMRGAGIAGSAAARSSPAETREGGDAPSQPDTPGYTFSQIEEPFQL